MHKELLRLIHVVFYFAKLVELSEKMANLTSEQKLNLLNLAKDQWIQAQSIIYAYERGFRRSRTFSDKLKIGTILLAVLTGLSTLQGKIPFLALATSVLTAVSAGLERLYAPQNLSQILWDCRSNLEEIKRDIAYGVMELDITQDFASAKMPLSQCSKRLTDVTREPFDIEESDQAMAQDKFKETVVASMIARYSPVAVLGLRSDEDKPSLLGTDAPGVVAVIRG